MDDEEIRDDLEEENKTGRIPRRKPLLDDDLVDPLDTIDTEETTEETAEESGEEDGAEEDEY